MKELLGWYGYDSHTPTDIAASNSSNMSHDLTSTISNDIGSTVTMLMNSTRQRTTLLTDKLNNTNGMMDNVDLTRNMNCADKSGWYTHIFARIIIIINDSSHTDDIDGKTSFLVGNFQLLP